MKIISVLPLLFFIVSVCYSQEQKPDYTGLLRKKIITQIGFCAGPSLSFLRGNPAVETNEVNERHPKLGYTLGISATHIFSDRVSIDGFALLEKKGSIVKSENTYFDEPTQSFRKGMTKEDYIYTCYTFPVLLDYMFGKKKMSEVSVGPYVSYIQKQIVRTTHYPGSVGISDQTSFNKKFDMGAAVCVSQRVALTETIFLRLSVLNVFGITDTRSIKNYGITKTNSTSLVVEVILNG